MNKGDTTQKITTGVPGMDEILQGGFVKGGVYLLLGPPGTGKTIFANQLSFHHATNKSGNVVYVTLLAESHGRMMENLSSLAYYQDDKIADSIHYMGGYHILEKEGLKGFLKLLAGIIKEKKASILIIDGMSTIGELEHSAITFRKFTHELNSYISSSGCTAFLLSSNEGHLSRPEHTMVDGIISFHYHNIDSRVVRQVEIRKFRGSGHSYGKHQYKIDENGITVFPRLEATRPHGHSRVDRKQEISFGIKALDDMMTGGPYAGSVMTLIGSAGTGKTTMSLQFLVAGAQAGEVGLHFGFYEDRADLLDKGDSLGMDLGQWEKKGLIHLMWHPSLELEMDELGQELLQAVQKIKARRVVIDGVAGFSGSVPFPERLSNFLVALVRRLKFMGVTVLIIEESSIFGPNEPRKIAEHSSINENVMYFHHIDLDDKIITGVTILKMRNKSFDKSTRELDISHRGIEVGAPVVSSQTTLTQNPRPVKGRRKGSSKNEE